MRLSKNSWFLHNVLFLFALLSIAFFLEANQINADENVKGKSKLKISLMHITCSSMFKWTRYTTQWIMDVCVYIYIYIYAHIPLVIKKKNHLNKR